jgi:antitoxin component HigA of HigAB toxin-antitoxin module
LVKSEFERQTQKKYATIRAEEIHHEDLRKIQKYVEDNPELTMEEAVNIYYDVQGTGTQAMKYQRGNLLVPMMSIKI